MIFNELFPQHWSTFYDFVDMQVIKGSGVGTAAH